MAVQGSRVRKSFKNKGLISDLEKKVIDLTDTALRLQEDIQRWKEWQAHYCFVFEEAYKRTLEKRPSSYSFLEKSQWSACEKELKNILATNKKLGVVPKRVPVNFQEYLIWEQEHVFNPKFYSGTAWLPYQSWIDEWERLTDIIHQLEQGQSHYDTVGSYDADFYLQLWSDLKAERNKYGRVAIQIIRNSKFAYLEYPPGSPGLLPSPASLLSADLNLSPPLRTARPDVEPLLDSQESSLQHELLSKGFSSSPNDINGHLKFLVTMDHIFLKHINYAQDWLLKLSELLHRSEEQIETLRKTYHELPPWQKASQDSLDALNLYATTFQDDHEHEIHMKARLAAQKQNQQIARTEKLQEKYTVWHEILVEKQDGIDLDGLEGRNIVERNNLVRLVIRHRVHQIRATRPRHSEARYDAVIIDTVSLVAKRNHLDLELEEYINHTESRYGEDQALILRQQRRKYTEWREEKFKDFYKKTRPESFGGELAAGSEPLFTAMSNFDNEENLKDIYEFKEVLDEDYTRFKQLCLEAGFWAEAKEPPLSPQTASQSSTRSSIPMDPEQEFANYPQAGARIRAFLTSPDIAPEFDTPFFRNDCETFINRCSNYLAIPLTATQREKWHVFLTYCTEVKDLFVVDSSNMVRRIEAGWGFYWRNPVAGPARKRYNVKKPSAFEAFRQWVIASRWLLDLGDEAVFRRDLPKQILYQSFVDAKLGVDTSFDEFRNIIKYCHGKRQLFLMTPGDNLRRINVGWPAELPCPKHYDSWFKIVLMGARATMQIVVGTKTTVNQLYQDFHKAETNPRIKLTPRTSYRMSSNEFLENLTFAIDRCEMFRRVGETSSGDDILVITDRGWAQDAWGGTRAGGEIKITPRKK